MSAKSSHSKAQEEHAPPVVRISKISESLSYDSSASSLARSWAICWWISFWHCDPCQLKQLSLVGMLWCKDGEWSNFLSRSRAVMTCIVASNPKTLASVSVIGYAPTSDLTCHRCKLKLWSQGYSAFCMRYMMMMQFFSILNWTTKHTAHTNEKLEAETRKNRTWMIEPIPIR